MESSSHRNRDFYLLIEKTNPCLSERATTPETLRYKSRKRRDETGHGSFPMCGTTSKSVFSGKGLIHACGGGTGERKGEG